MGADVLTNLSEVKSWLSLSGEDAATDTLLWRLIKSASTFALNYMNRDGLARTQYNNQLVDGYGNPWITLREFPVISIDALSVGSRVYNPATGTPPTNGYWLDEVVHNAPQKLSLLGCGTFPRQRMSILLSYTAGYFVANEPQTIGTVEIDNSIRLSTDQFYLQYFSVAVVSSGIELEYVNSAEPGPMQYWVNPETGVYYFNSAQAGLDVLISYSYVPSDIVMGVTELVGERFKAKDRIGVNSKALGGQETVSFNNQSMSHHVREMFGPYRRVF